VKVLWPSYFSVSFSLEFSFFFSRFFVSPNVRPSLPRCCRAMAPCCCNTGKKLFFPSLVVPTRGGASQPLTFASPSPSEALERLSPLHVLKSWSPQRIFFFFFEFVWGLCFSTVCWSGGLRAIFRPSKRATFLPEF